MKQFKILVNGKLIDSSKKMSIINSSDNSVAGEVPLLLITLSMNERILHLLIEKNYF